MTSQNPDYIIYTDIIKALNIFEQAVEGQFATPNREELQQISTTTTTEDSSVVAMHDNFYKKCLGVEAAGWNKSVVSMVDTNPCQSTTTASQCACRTYGTNYETFKTNFIEWTKSDNSNPPTQTDTNNANMYIAFQFVASKIPLDANTKIENVYDFHVVRVAMVVIFKMVYSYLQKCMLSLVAELENGTNAQQTLSNMTGCARLIDTMFGQPLSNEIDAQYADESKKGSLAEMYVLILEQSQSNTESIREIKKIYNDINGYKQTMKTALQSELQLKGMLFRSWLSKWAWIIIVVLTIGMAALFGTTSNYAVFYAYAGVISGLIIIMFIISLLGIDISDWDVLGFDRFFIFHLKRIQ